LGTTHSAVSILQNGIPIIISIPNNGRTMPSVVHIKEDGEVLVGQEAIEQEVHRPFGTYRNVKRVIGTGSQAAAAVAKVVPNLILTEAAPSKSKKWYKNKAPTLAKRIQESTDDPARLYLPPIGGGARESVLPEVLSSHILRKLFDAVTLHTNQTVTRAVVGVPAYFHDGQREATIRACELAGVPKVRLLREPEAAAFSYGVGKEQLGAGDTDELVLVFDLGGGTYDVSMLLVGGGLTQVISTSGNTNLGGADFDLRVAQHFSKIMREHGTMRNFLNNGGQAADAMVRAAEASRIYLSNNRKVPLALPLTEDGWKTLAHAQDVIISREDVNYMEQELTEKGTSNKTHVLCMMTRKEMEILCKEELQELLRPLREVAIMSEALLPGDARPSVVEAAIEMEEELERAMSEGSGTLAFDDFYMDDEGMALAAFASTASPEEVQDVDPDILLQLQSADAKQRKKDQQGGRKKARSLAKDEKKFREEKRKINAEVTDVKVRDGITGRPISQVVLVGGATRMPAIGRLLAALTGVVPQRTVNPDEAVALGCAVQAGVLDGNADLGGLTVLTPMQAAIMRAIAEKEGMIKGDDFDDEEFDSVEYY
jgi:molecular chaperone DnaK (HSP70)